MKNVLLFALFTLSLSAQVLRQGDIEIIAGPLGMPCEPGDTQFGFWPCPPIDRQGLFIHVRAVGEDFASYLVTVTYRTAAGELKTATCGGENQCPKRKREFGTESDDGWRSVAFQIGRVATGTLSGITVESIAVTKVPVPSASFKIVGATITAGSTTFGPPK